MSKVEQIIAIVTTHSVSCYYCLCLFHWEPVGCFNFGPKHFLHALIHLTDKIREQLDKGNFACGISVDFQKAFDTVDHQILIQKLNYYGIRGIANNWFSSYLQNRTQFVSINGFGSDVNAICCGVLQGSIIGPPLFLIYIK